MKNYFFIFCFIFATTAYGQTNIGNANSFVRDRGYFVIDSFGLFMPFLDSSKLFPDYNNYPFVYVRKQDSALILDIGPYEKQVVTLDPLTGKVPISQIPGGLGNGTVTSVTVNGNHIFSTSTANPSTNPVTTTTPVTVNPHKVVINSSSSRGPLDTGTIAWTDISSLFTAGSYIGISNGLFYFDTAKTNLNLNNFNVGIGKTNVPTNTVVGRFADTALTTGLRITALGSASLQKNKSGSDNVAIGDSALASDTGNSQTTAIGSLSLAAFKNGASGSNTAVGYASLGGLTTGTSNTAVGTTAGNAITNGSGNTLLGHQAGKSGSYSNNTFLGFSVASSSSLSGSNNTIVGSGAAVLLTSGASNSFFGQGSGASLTTGSYNVFIGGYTGLDKPTSSNRIVISDGQANVRVHVESGRWVLGDTSSADDGVNNVQIPGSLRIGAFNTSAYTDASVMVDASGNITKLAFNQTLTVSGNTTIVIPAGLQFYNISFIPAGSETIKIGTTPGGVDVMAPTLFSASVAGSVTGNVTIGKRYNTISSTTLYIQGAIGSVQYIYTIH